MGIIPAAGGSVAQWIAYAWEIRRAKPGDKFLTIRISSNDTSVTHTCVEMRTAQTSGGVSFVGIPTLGTWTVIGLGAGLLLLGVFLIVRRTQ